MEIDQSSTSNGGNTSSSTLKRSAASIFSLLSSHDNKSSSPSHSSPSGLSFFVIVAFTANYVMGTGFLTIPWAFYKCGVLLSSLVLFFMIGPSVMSISIVLEAIARANILKTMDSTILSSDTTSHDLELSSERGLELKSLQDTPTENPIIDFTDPEGEQEKGQGTEDTTEPHLLKKVALPLIGNKKYETAELCELFLGKFGKQCYAISISIFLYGTLWAYGTVFASAMVTHVDLGPYSYHIFLGVFSLIVIPLSCMELTEQLYLQVALAFCRIIMVCCMVGTVLYATASPDKDLFHLNDSSSSSTSSSSASNITTDTYTHLHPGMETNDTDTSEPLTSSEEFSPFHNIQNDLFRWNGLHLMLPIAVYSNMFHHSIPALSEPAADKKQLTAMFTTALLACLVSYTLIGIIVSLYFGETILSSSNLNWEHFGSSSSSSALRVIVEKALASYVIIFPALDVSSAFPLNAITLGNNLYTTFYSDTRSASASSRSSSNIRSSRSSSRGASSAPFYSSPPMNAPAADAEVDDTTADESVNERSSVDNGHSHSHGRGFGLGKRKNLIRLPTDDEDEGECEENSQTTQLPAPTSRKTLILFRLLAAIPPLLFAGMISDLGTITDYTGISGMLLAFIFPGLLSIASERTLSQRELPTKTYYSSFMTSKRAAVLLIIFGVSMISFTLISLLLTDTDTEAN
jgi:hypothetical protein